MEEIIGGLVILAGFVLIVFIIARYTYLIKKAMIEKGLQQSSDQKIRYIDIACIIIGLGVGLLIASLFTEMDLSEDTLDLLIWGTITISAGLGFVIAHLIRKKIG